MLMDMDMVQFCRDNLVKIMCKVIRCPNNIGMDISKMVLESSLDKHHQDHYKQYGVLFFSSIPQDQPKIPDVCCSNVCIDFVNILI